MMRSPGARVAPWAVKNDRTKATVSSGSSVMAPGCDLLVRLVDDGDHRPGIDAGHLVSEDDAPLADVGGKNRLDVVEGHVEVDELEGGRESGDTAVVADPNGNLDLDRGGPPPADRDDGAVGAHAAVDEVPDDGVSRPKTCWIAGVLKPIFQPTGAAPAASSASRRASRACMPRVTAPAVSRSDMEESRA